MPTLFWLVCPLLVHEVSRLESQGWIRVLGQEVASHPEAAAAEARADRSHAILRRRLLPRATRRQLRAEKPRLWARLGLSGVAGRQSLGVKCLHAHLAHYLALGDGYVGRRVAQLLRQEAIPLDGSLTCRCVSRAGEGPEARPHAARRAVVELGSHSVRALVAQGSAADFRIVEQHLWVTRMGEGLHDGVLEGPPLERTLDAAARLARRARAVGASRLWVVGTSAAREVSDQAGFARQVQEATGAKLRVLAGREEARYTFRGALLGLGERGPALVVDLGGGSVELARGPRETGPARLASLPWGALRLARRFGTGTHPARVADLMGWLDNRLSQELSGWRDAAAQEPLVAVGGTATSLAAMDQGLLRYRSDRVHGYRLSMDALQGWLDRLAGTSPQELAHIPGLQPERAPVILAGAAILTRLASWLGAKQVRVSEWDLMAGLLDEGERPPEGQAR